ncbi:MAG: hypothetical protein HY685_01760 [Chloroflexi bacterium]|nr:hypothetical protein [Chloroflexota bacterium]
MHSLALYLRDLRGHLRLEPEVQRDALQELRTHLEDRADELVAAGWPREEATAEAIRLFGDPRAIARQLSEVHATGSWLSVALASLPHLLIGLLFAFHLWLNPFWHIPILMLMGAVGGIALLRGRPVWAYSWLGYALFPVMLGSLLALIGLGQAAWYVLTRGYILTSVGVWIAIVLLAPPALFASCYAVLRLSRRDWLHATLLVTPYPVLAISLLIFSRGSHTEFLAADTSTALVLLFVALAVAAAVRLGRRFLKIAILLLVVPLAPLLIAQSIEGDAKLFLALLLGLPALLLLLSPLLLSFGSRAAAQRTSQRPSR